MELLLRAAAAALAAAVIGLLIRRKNPELALLLSACTVVMILIAASGFLDGLQSLLQTVRTLGGGREALTEPLVKCFAVGLVTKMSAELCSEASNRAAASAIELAGSVCAMGIVMPLLLSMLKMIGGMV